MSQSTYVAEASRRMDAGLTWLVAKTGNAWDALARSASGEGVGGSSNVAAAPGPAVVLMAGGLATLAAVMTLLMARQSLSSAPDPVNTRSSRRKARESVDIYVGDDTDPTADLETAIVSELDEAPEDGGPGEASAGGATTSNWTVVQTPSADRAGRRPSSPRGGSDGAETVVQGEERGSQTTAAGPTPLGPFQRGRSAGQRVQASDAREVFAAVRAANLGKPTVQQSTPNLYEIRLDGCRGCGDRKPSEPGRGPREGCPFEAGFLEGAMSLVETDGVVVRETTCRRRGAEACVFEVWY